MDGTKILHVIDISIRSFHTSLVIPGTLYRLSSVVKKVSEFNDLFSSTSLLALLTNALICVILGVCFGMTSCYSGTNHMFRKFHVTSILSSRLSYVVLQNIPLLDSLQD